MVWLTLLIAAIAPHEYPEQDWWPGLVRSVEGTDSYEEYLEQRGVELQDNGFLPLTANAVDNKLYYFAHPDWEPSCGEDLDGPLLPSGWSRIVQAEPEPPERIRIEAEVLKDMAEKTFVNPADEAWDVNLAWQNTEVDGSGDLAVGRLGAGPESPSGEYYTGTNIDGQYFTLSGGSNVTLGDCVIDAETSGT